MRRICKLLAFLCAAALLLSLAGCGAGGSQADPYGDIPASTGGKEFKKKE